MNKPLSTKSFLHPHPEEPWVLPLACPGFCCPSRYQEAQVAATPGNLLTPWPLNVTLLCFPPMSLGHPFSVPFSDPFFPQVQALCTSRDSGLHSPPSFRKHILFMTSWSPLLHDSQSVFLPRFLIYTPVQVSTSISNWTCRHHKLFSFNSLTRFGHPTWSLKPFICSFNNDLPVCLLFLIYLPVNHN